MSLRFNLALLLMLALLTQLVDGRRKLCGDALNEALDLICVNGFSHRIKRDSDRSRLLLVLRQQLDTGEQPQAPAERINGAGVERVLKRSRRRITHKCCWDGCTYDDIREYCA
ncbi:PREDICTED: probable insulin-like peptide 4 [Drosophila arizonae]|uniref:Probable insulin-like peptide 4 n=1 Tax=Drosophila arizonae TaxID=7263 RepID=A0ABM1P3I3_DROAR|nr:PREDICTED: probable insulin-like peptide 4 [Drosophila arizonae]